MSDDRNIIKLRGLPWNSTIKDILDFLKECQVVDGEKGVHLAISHRDGRPNGEAFVELATVDDVEKAFEYNKNVLGHRYIEIFNAKPEEFEMCLKRQNLVQHDTFIKLRGLPFSCKAEDIEQFFEGLEIRNGTNGIYIVYDSRARPTGEAFVQFCNSEDTDLAMKKNREKIGHRYIEIFRSSSSECRRSTIFNTSGRGNNGGGNGNGGGMGGGGGGGGGGGLGFNNDRMGRGQRNNRTNFRDRPYPDAPWTSSNNNNSNNNNDAPWRNNNRGNNSSFGGGNSNNNSSFNDNFDSGNNLFNTDSNFSSDFERNWNSGGGNSYNSFGGGSNKNNSSSFDREFGFNNFSNNSSNSGSGNGSFGNDRFMNNGGGGGGGGGGGNMNNSGGNSGGGGQYAVHLRGMPYDCGESEVHQFFAPLELVGCQILYNGNGRHSGEANAYFGTVAEAQEAMKKHKEKMGSRYIELFAKTPNNERRGGGGGGGGNGGRF